MLKYVELFLVLIFALFLSNCSTGTSVVSSGSVYEGMSKQQLRNKLFSTYPGDDPFLTNSKKEFRRNEKIEIIWGTSNNVFYVFENVTSSIDCGLFTCNYGNGQLKSWHYSLNAAKESLQPNTKKIVKKNTVNITKVSQSSEMATADLDKLQTLIKDFENGNISEEEFNKEKSKIIK